MENAMNKKVCNEGRVLWLKSALKEGFFEDRAAGLKSEQWFEERFKRGQSSEFYTVLGNCSERCRDINMGV